jgi:dihydroorotate dehydrogenase
MLYEVFNLFLKQTDPETAHQLAIKFLKSNIFPLGAFKFKGSSLLESKVMGINFENPVGVAAGFDKNAEVYNSMFKLGFGHAEVGTVTPQPQRGNDKPRVFRLDEDMAVINRLGFPNEGMDHIFQRIITNPQENILGINIGPNKENATKNEDYIICLNKFYEKADYIAINISSPNTPNLRTMHDKVKIIDLIDTLHNERSKKKKIKPIIFKLSPNINDEEIDILSEVFLDKKVDGLILTNTSIRGKENLIDNNKNEEGGLSGNPLHLLSNKVISNFYKNLKGSIPIVGVGGVSDGVTAYEKIKSGANLIQLYTAMVFKGPYIASKINVEICNLLKKDGFKNISEAVGVNAN